MRLPMTLLFLVLLFLLTACGSEQQESTPEATASSTLHVRAAGMVKSMGIT